MDRSLISVVVPIYNEASSLPELERRLLPVIDLLDFDAAEVVLVSDGSTDGSEDLVRDMARRNSVFRGVFLTRNFGHQAAISIGLEHVRGSVVAVMDGDLQDPPEVLPRLVEALENGADVAYGVRRQRKEGPLKRVAYAVFYRLLRWASSIPIPLDSGDFCCMRREVVEAMRRLPERTRFVRGLRAWVGFRQVGVDYERQARFADRPRYSLGKLVRLAYDGLFSFSSLPVRVIQLLGFLVSMGAILVAIYYLVWSFLEPEKFPPGFATITVSVWLLAGIQLLFLGIVGEYVVRAADEARGRPVALVREVVGSDTDEGRRPSDPPGAGPARRTPA